jgi:hypothetical protein
MKLEMKVDPESKAPVIQDGKILYIDLDDNNRELPLDPVQLYTKVADLGKENQNHRTKLQETVELYSPFKDIEDLTAWKSEADKALETVANFNDKDWMKADKVEKLKAEMNAAWEDKLKLKDQGIAELKSNHEQEINRLNGQIRELMVSNKFSQSKYFGPDSITGMLPEVGEAYFGKSFKVEVDDKGRPVTRGYYDNGDMVTSKLNPGEPADFEEAIGLIIDAHPKKNSFIKASSGGSGAGGGSGDGAGGGADELSQLEAAHQKATKEGRMGDAIALKNKIFKLRQQLKNVA